MRLGWALLCVAVTAAGISAEACADARPGGAIADAGADAASDAATEDATSGCYVAADCNQATEVCDPETRACVPYQCNALLECPPGELCVTQGTSTSAGACYLPCTPFAPAGSGCPAGQECRSARIDGTLGACLPPGEHQLGEPCVDSVVSTDCAPGLWCFKTFAEVSICAEPCDYWGGNELCPSNLRCHPDLVCAPTTSAVAAGVGQPCVGAPNELWACAADATRFAGLCVQEGASLICRAMCRTALGNGDCEVGETCSPSSYNPILGFCRP